MKNINKIIAFSLAFTLSFFSCTEQLDIKNPNNPTPASATNEKGIIALASGSIYINGFTASANKYFDGVVGAFYNGVLGIHDLMGDQISAEAANSFMNQISSPDLVTLSNGTKIDNPNSPKTFKEFIRSVNFNSNQGSNPAFHEWAMMYGLNSAANNIISVSEKVNFSGNAVTKKNTIEAWAYFWKGFAYSRIGSMYYAGIINDVVEGTNGNYVSKAKMIAASNANLDKAVTLLNNAKGSDYENILGKLIPDYFQEGKGGVLNTAEWIRNINTLKARNLLLNTPLSEMTTAQWNALLLLTNAGIRSNDFVFTGRTNERGDIFSPASYNIGARAVGSNASGGTYKISERLIQDFKEGDKRLAQNFNKFTAWVGNTDRGNSFNTRWAIKDGGNGLAGVYTYTNRTAGAGELYLVGSYEENELMKAEANIFLRNFKSAALSIDNVRKSQGAGLEAIDPEITTDELYEELRKERRVALAFRGLSFYDARRWNIINIGRKNAVIVTNNGSVDTKATISYGLLDYWDVPDNELAYNPPAAGSDPVKNPNK